MKIKLALILCALMSSTAVFAQQQAEEQTEAQCTQNVQATIEAIETTENMTGTEKKLQDMSITDIREIQKSKGSCVALQEINKRTVQ